MANQEAVNLVKGCIQYGDFTLHSGRKSDWVCNLMIAHVQFDLLVSHFLKPKLPVIGIELGGALLAVILNPPLAGIARKDGTIYAPYGCDRNSGKEVSLIDDVVTTESSILAAKEAIEAGGLKVGNIYVVLDRRRPEDKTLEINSLVTAADLGLE